MGTVFISAAEDADAPLALSPKAQARAAREAARALAALTYDERSAILCAVADALEASVGPIGEANRKDVAAAAAAKMSPAMAARLVLPPKKLKAVADGIRSLAAQVRSRRVTTT